MIKYIAVGLLLVAGYALSDDSTPTPPTAPSAIDEINCTNINVTECCSTPGCQLATCGKDESCHPLSHFEPDGECEGINGTCTDDGATTSETAEATAPTHWTTKTEVGSITTPATEPPAPSAYTGSSTAGKKKTSTTLSPPTPTDGNKTSKPASSEKPATSTTIPEKASDAKAGGFDKGSFFGGIALAVGVVVIICLARFFYRRRTNGRQYNRFI